MINKIKSNAEKQIITKFIVSLSEKNYSDANKLLKKIVESKLNKRVAKIINNF